MRLQTYYETICYRSLHVSMGGELYIDTSEIVGECENEDVRYYNTLP